MRNLNAAVGGGRRVFVSCRTGLCQVKVMGKLHSEWRCRDVLPAGVEIAVCLLWVDFCITY